MSIIKRTLGFFLLAGVILIAYTMVVYNPKYIIGYVLSGSPPGNNDFRKFPVMEVCQADSIFYFQKKPNEDYVESLFKDRIRLLRVASFAEYIEMTKTTALIVVKNDTIIYEKYFNGFNRNDLSMGMSMTKAYVNTLVGIAIADGYIGSMDDPITRYLPELKERDIRFEKIKIKHLSMMCSGIDPKRARIKNVPLPWDDEALTYGHPQLRRYILDRLDIIDEPGMKFDYVNYNTELLGLVLERAIDRTASEYLEEYIWKPCGMEYPALWMYDSEESGFEKMSSGLFARPIDYAKYGRLYLRSGDWNGNRILSEQWVRESTSESADGGGTEYYPDDWPENAYYKYHWKGFVNPDSTITYSVGGVMGQNILIAPPKDLVIVHCGESHSHYGVEDLRLIARLIGNPFYDRLHAEGLIRTVAHADLLLNRGLDIDISENRLNSLGYNYLYEDSTADAIAVFALNVRAFPLSSNVYDSLAEAYVKSGQDKLAKYNYEKSLELNPDNENAKEQLLALQEQTRPIE